MDKIKTKDKEEFKTVEFFRRVKEQIAKETYHMTFEELKEYIEKRKIHTKKKADHTTTL